MSKKLKLNIARIRKVFVRRKYKDLLFQRVFREKKDLLDLYNAVNGTNYTNYDELEITTLEDALYLSMKNDKSFIISSTLNLYEHQSTVNPNMPIRGLMYFARLYEGYISANGLDIYGRKPVNLPTPHYIVFYNGIEEIPDKTVLKLSDVFTADRDSEDFPVLECSATVLNINYGHNEGTLSACKRLGDYSHFIYKVNEGIEKGLGKAEAIEKAIDYCIEHDILADILSKYRGEVMSSILTYTEKQYKKTLKREAFEDGYESRQQEIDELNEVINEKDNTIAKKDETITKALAENEKLTLLLLKHGIDLDEIE